MNSPGAKRAVFFVDGFNLYHSICEAQKAFPSTQLKWLDVCTLFSSHLDQLEPGTELLQVRYYTAYADHLRGGMSDKPKRHRAYVRALTATGVQVEVNQFKRKDSWDSYTGEKFVTHEEKETDVAMACAVLEGGIRDEFDTAVLVTGDTDLRPVAHAFQRLFPAKRLVFAFPFHRKNSELAGVASGYFTLSAESYAKHQFAARVKLPSGKYVHCPKEWIPAPAPEEGGAE